MAAKKEPRHWSLMTRTRKGVVSILRDLTEREAAQVYESLDPYRGQTVESYVRRRADGTTTYGSNNYHAAVGDGEIEQREVFGPAGWKWFPEEIAPQSWPKFVTVECDENGMPLDRTHRLWKMTETREKARKTREQRATVEVDSGAWTGRNGLY